VRLGDAGRQALIEFVGERDRVRAARRAPVVTDDEPETETPDEPAAETADAGETPASDETAAESADDESSETKATDESAL